MQLNSRKEITDALRTEGDKMQALFTSACAVRDRAVGNGVYLRGLIEYSNICSKNCLYCGIRSGNVNIKRYTLSEAEVLEAARYAHENRFGSVVIQAGERQDKDHVGAITGIIRKIKDLSGGTLGITLSLGEQSKETYERWFEAGAHRYLLRIESSDPSLYEKIHPQDGKHSYESRLGALQDLKDAGYQVGTGVMIGLPFQTIEDLAGDLMFIRELDADMCGMGPYIISRDTPLASVCGREYLPSGKERLALALKMIACLRLMVPDMNIASTTALQAIDPAGRLLGVEAGANVIMPNLSPFINRGDYSLYDNKPLSADSMIPEENIRYGEWGDPVHFRNRNAR